MGPFPEICSVSVRTDILFIRIETGRGESIWTCSSTPPPAGAAVTAPAGHRSHEPIQGHTLGSYTIGTHTAARGLLAFAESSKWYSGEAVSIRIEQAEVLTSGWPARRSTSIGGRAKVTLAWRFVVARALSIGRSVVDSKRGCGRRTRAVSRPETSAVDLQRSSPFVQFEYSLHSSLVAVLVFRGLI
jgi:hypothetical protein